jgi:hypothetical protein
MITITHFYMDETGETVYCLGPSGDSSTFYDPPKISTDGRLALIDRECWITQQMQ